MYSTVIMDLVCMCSLGGDTCRIKGEFDRTKYISIERKSSHLPIILASRQYRSHISSFQHC